MGELTRYSIWCDIDGDLNTVKSDSGEWVTYDDVAPLLEELSFTREMAMKALDEAKALKAENAALRTRVLEWVTVTDDPETFPTVGSTIIKTTGRGYLAGVVFDTRGARPYWMRDNSTGGGLQIQYFDRWTYIPEAQP